MRANPAKVIIATILVTIFIIITVISLVLFFREPDELKDNEKAQNNSCITLADGEEVCDYAMLQM
ncbi:MAG: hypothetical protein IJ141_03490 [Lachnospiraceae bacterium]|nr:hypothetical protein [Lachnospiraceae bacterium]